MAQTMRVASQTELKGATKLAPQRTALHVAHARPVRLQNRQVAQASTAWTTTSRVQRASHVVCVAAQEAPAQQTSGTQVRIAPLRSARLPKAS